MRAAAFSPVFIIEFSFVIFAPDSLAPLNRMLKLKIRSCFSGLSALAVALAMTGSAFAAPAPSEPVLVTAPVRVVFSPEESGVKAIGELVGRAQKEVRLSAFHFKSKAVAEILAAAKNRGVDVQVIIDPKNLTSTKCTAQILTQAGIPVYVDSEHRTAHNKYIIVDERYVETGSYNYSDHAERKNAENMLIIDSPELARRYLSNWDAHRAHSKLLAGALP